MRKILICLLISVIFCGCLNKQDEVIIENEDLDKVEVPIINENEEHNDEDYNYDSKYFQEISANKFKEMVNSKNKYIFFIGRETCPACRSFKPTVKEFAKKESFYIYYVNSTDFTDNDWNIIDSIVKVNYIPTIVISNNSKILYNEHGVKNYDTLKSLVNEYLK